MIGQLIAERYQIIQCIGEGGMAVVFRAKDLRTGHDVALKFLRPEFKANPDFLSRFDREATAASKMSHHNIVNLLDVGYSGDNPYIVIEYVDGKTLKDIIRERKQLPEDVSCQIAIRILSALQHAHQAGIIHRDIKPQNILVDMKGYIKVSDFGIARMVGANTATMTDANNSVMGSVHYFSPEQARGETATAASDLYSAGIVLYEMLTGTVPFDGETPVSIALQHVQARPRPIRELAADVSPAMEAVVMKALEKNPANRYHTALEMAQALKIARQFPEKEITLDTPVIAIGPGRKTPSPNRRRRMRERTLIIVMTIALLLALGLGTFFIIRDVVFTTRAPYLMYSTEQEAIREAEKAGLKPQIVRQSSSEPAGTVILQSHDFDYPMKRGDTILITVSSGPIKQMVPRLTGLLKDVAEQELERIGLKLLQTDRLMNPAAVGTILTQSPEQGTELDYGGIVQVVISGGEVTIPNLEGEIYADWLLRLQNTGLIVSKVSEVAMEDPAQAGRIAAQNPRAGEKVMTGTTLELAVYVLKQPGTAAP
ncbi:MAG: protein kinase [Christensenellales bacterium]